MNAAELLETLDRQLAGLDKGETTPAHANAVAHVVSTQLAIVKAQLAYHRQRGTRPEMPMLDTPRASRESRSADDWSSDPSNMSERR